MSEISEKVVLDELTGNTGEVPTPGHDEWFRGKVRDTLDKKANGKMSYRSLDEVAANFGFNAR
ncbi:MAG: hypothetical protein AAF530_24150 [Pseudomonadota bacterium]